jgi:DNA-binding IclR family transcriptional regulator
VAKTTTTPRDSGSLIDGQSAVPATAGAQTVLRALDVLDCFLSLGPWLTLAEISRTVNLTSPTTHRLLKALVSRGIVVVDRDRRYSLGPAVVRLASAVMYRSNDLVRIASPTLESLWQQTGETVSLHCLIGHERVCVAEFVSTEPIRMESGVGHVYPLYAGAAGKAMLAWEGEKLDVLEGVADELPRVGPSSITSFDALEAELEGIRRRGYATSESEVIQGASSIAFPLFARGEVVGAINISGPAMRWNDEKIESLLPAVLSEVDCLAPLLASYRPSPNGV